MSFFSRLNIIGGKKKDQGDVDDDESELGDQRTEGMNAHVFSSSIGANGYIPKHKEPPRYIKVRAHNKKEREFNRMFLAQELNGTKHTSSHDQISGLTGTGAPHKISKSNKTNGAVWAAEFSKDGKYFAAAGKDQVVRVWAVISSPEERQAHEYDEDGEQLSAPVFRSKPVREFEGHTQDILDLSWSKNNFLLSSSMDKTVRLWHISRQECLCTFKHKDFVTSIAFHPRDDRFFLAGSLDSVLRLWSIPDKSVAFWNQLPDLITAVAFTPDGKTAIAGVLNGLCLFYETEGLKYHTQIHVRSSRGKNAKGSKITGIRTAMYPPDDPEGEMKVLITSNDSRVRMYNLRDKSLEMKFRSHENNCSQIKASFSDDAQYVICGSEDRKAYIWSTGMMDSEIKDKHPLEFFEAHSEVVTAAVIAPTKSRHLLAISGDPIYDLCNPPPVTLLSREESHQSSMPPPTAGSNSEKRLSDPVSESPVKKPEESPAYIARCSHPDGNIIITADYIGRIKVFRQDCAHQKRRNDIWETGSTFSKKMLGRSNSIMTRHSGGSHSRRNSVSQSSVAIDKLPVDHHILDWRNSITNGASKDRGGSLRSDRSVSPGKLSKNGTSTLASTARQQPYSNTNTPPTQTASSTTTNSPPQSIIFKTLSQSKDTINTSQPPTPSFSFVASSSSTDLHLDPSGKSLQFWNLSNWKNPLINNKDKLEENARDKEDSLRPDYARGGSVVSKLSSEEMTEESEEEEVVACVKCGGKDFRAKKVGGLRSGEKKLCCTKCGTVVE